MLDLHLPSFNVRLQKSHLQIEWRGNFIICIGSLYVRYDRIEVNTFNLVEVKVPLCSCSKALNILFCNIYKEVVANVRPSQNRLTNQNEVFLWTSPGSVSYHNGYASHIFRIWTRPSPRQ